MDNKFSLFGFFVAKSSFLVVVYIVTILDGTYITRATYICLGIFIGISDKFSTFMTSDCPGKASIIPCATIETLSIFSGGCEVILISPAPLVCTCTGVSDICGRIFWRATLIGTY